MNWKNRQVLVTGAAGFIGSHLTRRLVREGARVHILVRKKDAAWRIADLIEQVTLWEADLTDFCLFATEIIRLPGTGNFSPGRPCECNAVLGPC